MKATALFIAIFALALLTIPMIALNFDLGEEVPVHRPAVPEGAVGEESSEVPEVSPPPQGSADRENSAMEEDDNDRAIADEDLGDALEVAASRSGVSSFLILDETTGKVEEVSLQEFVRGAVAAEMPVSFHTEALKAQAVAAHTYALNQHLSQQQNPDPALKGADFSADPGNRKIYITEAQALELWGEGAGSQWKKICAAADSVLEYVLEYDDEPIVAAYHAISAGVTEDAGNVWNGSVPYLQPADSGGDLLAPDYETVKTFSLEEAREILEGSAYLNLQLGEDPQEWFGEVKRSSSGYVTDIEVGGAHLHGSEIRQLFDLRSHNFDLLMDDSGVTFCVYGYGHGVGLSQYGADFLARQGSTFNEILENYYAGAQLKRVEV